MNIGIKKLKPYMDGNPFIIEIKRIDKDLQSGKVIREELHKVKCKFLHISTDNVWKLKDYVFEYLDKDGYDVIYDGFTVDRYHPLKDNTYLGKTEQYVNIYKI